MTRNSLLALFLCGLPLPLSGCFDMPHPFANPGDAARKLVAHPPPGRLAVPAPSVSLLSNDAASLWARDMAQAMLAQSVPAVAQATRPGDWWLRMSATREGGQVVPHFAVVTPEGKARGSQDGVPIPAAIWSSGDPEMLAAVAQAEAPRVAQTLTGIQAAAMAQDPNSLMRRSARVYFAGVQGAPGDGDKALAKVFVAVFPDAKDTLVDQAKGADYTVRCIVKLGPVQAGSEGKPQQHIELAWHVVAADGTEAGAATQLHDIAAHSLDHAWGDVAAAAAEEAAGGVRQIISAYSGRDHKPLPRGK